MHCWNKGANTANDEPRVPPVVCAVLSFFFHTYGIVETISVDDAQ